jgi:hypothetical protein
MPYLTPFDDYLPYIPSLQRATDIVSDAIRYSSRSLYHASFVMRVLYCPMSNDTRFYTNSPSFENRCIYKSLLLIFIYISFLR